MEELQYCLCTVLNEQNKKSTRIALHSWVRVINKTRKKEKIRKREQFRPKF